MKHSIVIRSEDDTAFFGNFQLITSIGRHLTHEHFTKMMLGRPSDPLINLVSESTEEHLPGVTDKILEFIPSTKTIYIDLGVSVNSLDRLKRSIEYLRGRISDVRLGIIAPIDTYLEENGELVQYVLGNEFLFPCPFLRITTGLALQLVGIERLFGERAFCFISWITGGEKEVYAEIVSRLKIGGIVFWSHKAVDGIKWPDPPSEPDTKAEKIVSATALFSSVIRNSPSLSASSNGHIQVGEVVKMIVQQPDRDLITYGKLVGHGIDGYVVVKHGIQYKFDVPTTAESRQI